jgi:predicted small secreted protein
MVLKTLFLWASGAGSCWQLLISFVDAGCVNTVSSDVSSLSSDVSSEVSPESY